MSSFLGSYEDMFDVMERNDRVEGSEKCPRCNVRNRGLLIDMATLIVNVIEIDRELIED